MAIVAESCTAIVTAQDVLALSHRRLLSILTVADLPKKGLISELSLDFAFLFAHRPFVQESIGFLLKCLYVVLVQQLRPIELLDQLLVNPGLTRCAFRTQLHINELEDAVLELLSLRLVHLVPLRTNVVAVVQVVVHLLPNAQVLRLL